MQQEESNIRTNSTFLVKAKNLLLAIAGLMIALGSWNDTKDLVINMYEEGISRFTNEVEYNRLNKLRIGFTEQYTDDILGAPQVIKPSKIDSDVQFYYYSNNKFLLITFIKGQRLSGFTVIAKQDDFLAPVVYINKDLNTSPINDYLPTQDNIITNIGSIEYFAETYELSRDLMFYNLLLGHVNYGLDASPYSQSIIEVNHKLDFGEDFDVTNVTFSPALIPNFYAISDLSNEIMIESLLSHYEMSALFGKEE